uniref:Galectin n=1 Tax=Acrobeloides nanus TaxID=290746 RepID=A0A914EKA9_9BILA
MSIQNPQVPYRGPAQDYLQTRRVRIIGTPTSDADRFEVNFLSSDDEILFHFNPRLNENCIVRNATEGHQWIYEKEERENRCPFQPGKRFALDFIQDGQTFKCYVDGPAYASFTARININQLRNIEIKGDVRVEEIHFG